MNASKEWNQAPKSPFETSPGPPHDERCNGAFQEFGGCPGQFRAPEICSAVQPDRQQRSLPVSDVGQCSDKADGRFDPSAGLLGQSTSHSEVSLPQETGPDGQDGAICVGGQQWRGFGAVPSAAEIILSQFLATHPSLPEACRTPTQQSGQAASRLFKPRAVRIFSNKNGFACYMNSCCIGVAWLTLCCEAASADLWADHGDFLTECSLCTPAPLDVVSCFAILLGAWFGALGSIKTCQHDAAEFLKFLLGALRPQFKAFAG